MEPKHRSRTLRRVFKRTPGSKTILSFRARKHSKATCSNCGGLLNAVPREVSSKRKNLPKTKKRPERPYGGVLCSSCMRTKIVSKARKKE